MEPPRPGGWKTLVLAAVSYLCLALLWAAPMSLSPSETVPNHGDPLHLAWVMAWVAHQVVRNPLTLFEANAFYPHPRSLAFGDHLLPEALLVAPVFWATGNPVLASNIALLLALTLSATALFVLVQAVTGSAEGAWLAGLAYAFNSLTLHELPRVHVLNIQWWPLALLGLERFVNGGARGRAAALFAVALLMQCLSGTYYLAYSVLFAPLWLAGAYALAGRRPSPREARLLATASLAVLPMAVMLLPYLRQFRELGLDKRQPEVLLTLPAPLLESLRMRGFEGGFAPGADVLAYLDPDPGHPLWGRFGGHFHSEVPHFVGVFSAAMIVLGVASLARRRPGRELGALALITAVLASLLSLGSRIRFGGVDWGPGPYDLLYRYVPFARGMASPERFGVLVILGVAILIGLGAAWLFHRWEPRWRAAAAAAIAVLLLGDHWRPLGPGARFPAGPDLPSVYRWLRQDGDGPVIELPLYPEREKRLWATYLAFSAYHWRPVPIGRTSFYPPVHDRLAFELRGFPDQRSLTILDRLGVRTLVVHPLVWPSAEREVRLAALDAEPRLSLARAFDDRLPERFAALDLGQERVYRLRPGAAPSPPCRPNDEVPREGWEMSGSGITAPELARDGRPATAWFTMEPQRLGDHVQVVMLEPERVAALSLEMAYPWGDFPRGLELLVPGGAEGWQSVGYADGPEEAWDTIETLFKRPLEARLVLRFEPRLLQRFVLHLGPRDRDWASPRWSLSELRAYRRCE